MKKKNVKLLVGLLLSLLVGFASCEKNSCKNNKKTDWEKDNLKGKVKSYTNIAYEAIEKNGKVQKGKRREDELDNFLVKYGNKGNIVERNYYYYDGSLSWKYTYKYDSKVNRIEENWCNFAGKLYYKYTFKYDSRGNEIEKNEYDSDGSLSSKFTYKYDSKGNEIEKNTYNSDGKLIRKYTYKYGSKGNKIECNIYTSDGSLIGEETYKYDSKGNEIECKGYDLYQKYTYKNKYEYEYDKHGNWTKQIFYADDKPAEIVERKYEYYE